MTALWTPAALAAATGAAAPGFSASGVAIDSRTLAAGDLFVALVGEHGDGHDHVADALARGAAGAMVHRDVGGADGARGRLLRVADTLAGLHALGRFARARCAGQVVAVTGSVGKTTTKEMLRTLLGAFGPTHAAVASYNNHWGVPLTLARLPAAAAYAVVEIGMNHPGEIAPLARLASPHVAVITAIAAAHIGQLGSLEAIADEKAAILTALGPGGVAVLPADTPLLARLLARAGVARVVRFGGADDADIRLLGGAADADGSSVTVRVAGAELPFRLNAPGAHMAMNALAALAVAHALGLDLARAAAALAGFAPLAGRGRRRHIAVAGGAALLLDESYNASTASVRAALQVLALQPATRRIVVLGDMLELGADATREHAALAAPVADVADLVFTCGALMQHLHAALPPGLGAGHADDSAALVPLVTAALRPGDAVLVKGSLGSRMRCIIAALTAATEAH